MAIDYSSEKRALDLNLEQLKEAIDVCRKLGLSVSTQILLYSGLDTIGALDRQKDKEFGTREDFKKWCDKYFIPNLKYRNCKSEDLYAARCGIVHTLTPESKTVKEGKAKKIFYAWGAHKVEELEKYLDSKGYNAVALHMDDMIEAFKKGIDQYLSSVSVIKRRLIYERVKKMFINVDVLRWVES